MIIAKTADEGVKLHLFGKLEVERNPNHVEKNVVNDWG